ncbi:hypothetical protein ACT7DJ_28475 [Bacillus cereus]
MKILTLKYGQGEEGARIANDILRELLSHGYRRDKSLETTIGEIKLVKKETQMNRIKALLTLMETGIISPAKAIKEIKKGGKL